LIISLFFNVIEIKWLFPLRTYYIDPGLLKCGTRDQNAKFKKNKVHSEAKFK